MAVKVWLDQLFTPYVHDAYHIVRDAYHIVHDAYHIVREQHGQFDGFNNRPGAARAAHTPTDYLGQLNKCLSQSNRRVEWKFDDTIIENNLPLWSVKLVVDGDHWGYGCGSTKKAARNEAAKQGLTCMGSEVMHSMYAMDVALRY